MLHIQYMGVNLVFFLDCSISNPTLISGPSHLISVDKSQPHQEKNSETLSEKIKCYIRIVEVFSSIAKEDTYCVPITHVKKEEVVINGHFPHYHLINFLLIIEYGAEISL
jgi:hypothetical protein